METEHSISSGSSGFDGRRRWGSFTRIRDLRPGDQVEVVFQAGGFTTPARTSIVDIRPTSQANNPRVIIRDEGGVTSIGGGTIARRILPPQSQP